MLFSTRGGMDIEEIAATHPGDLAAPAHRHSHRARSPREPKAALPAPLPCDREDLVDALLRLYAVYAGNDAELVEINPLVVTKAGRTRCARLQVTIDDSALSTTRSIGRSGHA